MVRALRGNGRSPYLWLHGARAGDRVVADPTCAQRPEGPLAHAARTDSARSNAPVGRSPGAVRRPIPAPHRVIARFPCTLTPFLGAMEPNRMVRARAVLEPDASTQPAAARSAPAWAASPPAAARPAPAWAGVCLSGATSSLRTGLRHCGVHNPCSRAFMKRVPERLLGRLAALVAPLRSPQVPGDLVENHRERRKDAARRPAPVEAKRTATVRLVPRHGRARTLRLPVLGCGRVA
jgi:hypothetical protein